MTFTISEILAFNSVLDGKTIFGTHFKAPREPDDAYVSQTVNSLRDKGFLDPENNPNKLFALAANMLQDYKNAREHLFINKMRIALDGTKATLLTQTAGGFDLSQTSTRLFFQSIVLGMPYLCRADSGDISVKTVEPKQWAQNIEQQETSDHLWVQRFENQIITQAFVFYHEGEQGFIYNPTNETLTYCGSRLMRVTLMDLLNIENESVEEKA